MVRVRRRMSIIDERYERQVWPRGGTSGSTRGRPIQPLTDPAAGEIKALFNNTLDATRTATRREKMRRAGLPI